MKIYLILLNLLAIAPVYSQPISSVAISPPSNPVSNGSTLVGIGGSGTTNAVISGKEVSATIFMGYMPCPTEDYSIPSIEPTKLYFHKEGEPEKLITEEFTGRYQFPIGKLSIQDSGIYTWRVANSENRSYSEYIEVVPPYYLDIRFSRWEIGGCIQESKPYWFPSDLLGWNYSTIFEWPWVYQSKVGWIYLLLGEAGLWIYQPDNQKVLLYGY